MKHPRGFTLIEIIVTLSVVLILSSLGAVSMNRIIATTHDTEANAALDRAVFAQRAWLARNATWASDPTVLKPGRGLTISTGASADPRTVSIAVDQDNRLAVAVRSETGTCIARIIGDPLIDGTETPVNPDPSLACSGQAIIGSY